MGFWDFIQGLLKGVDLRSAITGVLPSETKPEGNGEPRPSQPDQPASPQPPQVLPDREGTFIVPDIYPPDLGPNPPFGALPHNVTQGKETIGCYLKGGEGLGWGSSNEAWFQRCWRDLGKLCGPEFFRGAYHFLRFDTDGAQQADYFLAQIEAAGGWGQWDLMPWVDVEEGGQGHWAPGKLENLDSTTKKRLAREVTKCVTDFIARMKQRKPGIRVGLYGRGIFRDLLMTDCRFGADEVCNPAYTSTMPPMSQYGWPDVLEWQLCGDSEVYAPGFPRRIPNWGGTDYSVIRVNRLSDVRKRSLAFPSS